MTINFVSLIFIWLLPLTASRSVTSGQNHNFTNVMTGEEGNKFTHDQLTTPEASRLNPLSEVSGFNVTQSIKVDVNPTEEKTTKPSSEPSLQTIQTTTSKTFLPKILTAANPNPISSQLNSSTVGMKSTTEVQFKVTSATMVVTSQDRNPTTTIVPAMLSRSTQSQVTGKTSTSQLTSDKITYPSTRPTQSTNLFSTTSTSAKPVENKSSSTWPVIGGDATQSKGLYKTSMAMTKTPFIHITKAKKSQDPQEKESKKGTYHSKAVAGLIGGALVLMMVGFLVIYIKKQKLQRQQLTTRDWAGPSPFLEGGADNDNGQVTLRSSNRISLSSLLPQRLSKMLSLLPETDEELEDMTPGTTFGDKHQGSTFGQEVDGNELQENNGIAVVVPEMQSTGDSPETVETHLSVLSEQPMVGNISQDHPANPPTLSGAVENALAPLSDDHGQP